MSPRRAPVLLLAGCTEATPESGSVCALVSAFTAGGVDVGRRADAALAPVTPDEVAADEARAAP